MLSFHGAWPALITPATKEGSLNIDVLRELTERLIAKGIGGLYLCGATGEGLLQSVDERKRIVEQAIDQIDGRVPAIVHVGCVATRYAVDLARHAQATGAAGVSSVLPLVGAGARSAHLHYRAIAAAVPDLPFYPYLYGEQTNAVTLIGELLQHIPNLAGSKYTGPNMFELQQLVDLGSEARDRWTIFSGMDEQCVFAAMSGAQANIGSTLNLMPGAYRELRESYERGDIAHARDLQVRANRVTRVLLSHGFPGALREAMRVVGFDCGEPRLPNPPLPAGKRAALHRELETAGLRALATM
jgi:dihydrodipicolinate synthase/N-acetylneuraminate lyase